MFYVSLKENKNTLFKAKMQVLHAMEKRQGFFHLQGHPLRPKPRRPCPQARKRRQRRPRWRRRRRFRRRQVVVSFEKKG